MGGVYRHERVVRFGECDPAGVVYYPVFFDWFHQAMEAWFGEALGMPYARVLETVGFPSARAEAGFRRPCRPGEGVAVEVRVEQLGARSLTLSFAVRGSADGEVRAEGRVVCVCIATAPGEGFRFGAVRIPDDLRARMEAFGVSGGGGGEEVR